MSATERQPGDASCSSSLSRAVAAAAAPTMTRFFGVISRGIVRACTRNPALRSNSRRATSIAALGQIGEGPEPSVPSTPLVPSTAAFNRAANARAGANPRWQHGTTATGDFACAASFSTRSLKSPHAWTDTSVVCRVGVASAMDASTYRNLACTLDAGNAFASDETSRS